MEKRSVNPWTYTEAYGYQQGVELRGVQRWLVCAGQASVDDQGHLVPGDMNAQFNKCLDNLEAVLKKADFSLADVVRMTWYTTDMDAGAAALEASIPRLAGKGFHFACAMIGVARLVYPELLCEVEATAAK